MESAQPEVLAAVNKGETIEDIERGIRLLQNAGIRVGGFFIVGLPGDSYAAQERSVAFARRLGLHAHFNMLVPYPGTRLWQWVREQGRFLRGFEEGTHFADTAAGVQSVFETPDFTAAQRRRVYEMVLTRTEQFGFLLPQALRGPRWHLTKLQLLARYDRRAVPAQLLATIRGAARAVIRRLWRRRGAAQDVGAPGA